MKSIVIIACLMALSQALSYSDLMRDEWNLFKLKFKKEYKDEIEENHRMRVYLDNKRRILRHNKLYEEGQVTFRMKMNQFGDLTKHEFSIMTRCLNTSLSMPNGRRPAAATYVAPENLVAPTAIDWRKKGAVTPVKNQGECGSCWSFSTTGAVEGHNFRKTGKLVSLSEQNLIDCSTDYGNSGCNGGIMDFAFEYIKQNDGIDTEKSYPYKAEEDDCKYDAKNKGATGTGYVDILEGSEFLLLAAVATLGPVSVGIDSDHDSFMFYSDGVFYEPECSSTALSHAVLVVGYGIGDNDEPYWLVKNSWGTEWGEDGYVRMRRNKGNNCGIASMASFPLV